MDWSRPRALICPVSRDTDKSVQGKFHLHDGWPVLGWPFPTIEMVSCVIQT